MTCAVCDNDHTTQRLCKTCRADPANADWVERWEGIEARVDPGADADDVHWHRKGRMDVDSPRSLGEMQDRRAKQVTELEREIVRLTLGGVLLPVLRVLPSRSQFGRYRVRSCRPRRIYLTQREMARRLGCTQKFIIQTQKRYDCAWF